MLSAKPQLQRIGPPIHLEAASLLMIRRAGMSESLRAAAEIADSFDIQSGAFVCCRYACLNEVFARHSSWYTVSTFMPSSVAISAQEKPARNLNSRRLRCSGVSATNAARTLYA